MMVPPQLGRPGVEIAQHLVMGPIFVIISTCVYKYVEVKPTVHAPSPSVLGWLVIAILVSVKFIDEHQKVYTIFGILRNKLYHYYVTSKCRKMLSVVRGVIVLIGAPLFMGGYLSLMLKRTTPEAPVPSVKSFLYGAAALRAFRVVWQNPELALLDITILHLCEEIQFMSLTKIGPYSVRLMVVGLVRNWAFEIKDKMFLIYLLSYFSLRFQKLRKPYSIAITIINLCLFPIVIGFVLVASVFSAPLLPLFTLPLFLVAFPRPRSFWPSNPGEVRTGPDAAFYQQMAPRITRAFSQSMREGRLGACSAGDIFLLRYEDRLAFAYMIERGNNYIALNIKGLELHETSCHTVEASKVDQIFDTAFDKTEPMLNPDFLHCLAPISHLNIKAYSDAKNILTGVLDSSETLELVSESFLKCFLWVLMHHCAKRSYLGDGSNNDKDKEQKVSSNRRAQSTDGFNRLPKVNKSKEFDVEDGEETQSLTSQETGHEEAWASRAVSIVNLGPGEKVYDEVLDKGSQWSNKPNTTEISPRIGSVSPSDSWNDDSDPLEVNVIYKPKKPLPPIGAPNMAPYDLFEEDLQSLTIDTIFGLMESPALYRKAVPSPGSTRKPARNKSELETTFQLTSESGDTSKPKRPPTRVTAFSELKSPAYSSVLAANIAPPIRWLDGSMDDSTLRLLQQDFPLNWFHSVIRLVCQKCQKWKTEREQSTYRLKKYGSAKSSESGVTIDDKEIEKAIHDSDFESVYRKLCLSVHAIVNMIGEDVFSLGPSHVHKTFLGEIPWSMQSSWLESKPELCALVIKAYRYGVKLALDQILVEPITDSEELAEHLQDFDDNWFIGNDSENSEEWSYAILREVPNLFALGYNPLRGTFTSHLLTLQRVPVYLGRVSPEVLRGQWAALSLELLYMTNDDDERYSIQAHPGILRNLSVQAADPPLGYPLFSSRPLRCGLLWTKRES